jgi:hypothetical protein
MSEHSSSSSQGDEKPLKHESDTEDSVKLSDVPTLPHDPEAKPELPAQLQKEPTPGNEGGKEREDSSQSQNSTAKVTEFVSSLSPNKKKRKAERDDIATDSPKRFQLKSPSGTGSHPKRPIPYNPRNQFRSIFMADDDEEDEKLDRLGELHTRGLRQLAIGLSDCEPSLRKEYMKNLSEEILRQLEKYIYDMYEFPKMYDVCNNFPKLITPSIVADMVQKKAILSPKCFVCNKPFKRFERYYPKPCEGHIMHYKCLAESFKKGKEVLNGHCECASSRR